MRLSEALDAFAANETLETAREVCAAARRERFWLKITDAARLALETFQCDHPKDAGEIIRFAHSIRRLVRVP